MRKTIFIVSFALAGLLTACGGGPKEAGKVAAKPPLYEPDKTLYERAQREMKRGRYDIARLTFQTLINTYPDSEYLPKAKYGLGESSFREGGRDKLDQAATEFEDYITFFPTTDDADDAQLMIALTHYKQMLAPDRDSTQARFALFELDKMIKEYPDSPLLEEAKSRRRVVQERLAEGEFRIGNLYAVRKQYLAAIPRYEQIIKTYPDYTKMDQVLYALGEIWRRGEVKTTIAIDNIPAGTCPCVIHYEKIVRDYPRSERVNDAKQRLKEMNWKIPEPNPAALARIDSKVEQRGIVGKVMGAVIDRGPADGNKTGATSVTVDSNKKRGEEALSATPKVIRP